MPDRLPVQLQISDKMRERIVNALIERVNTAIQNADERDSDLELYDAQLEGDLDTGDGPWKGSCRLHDPLTRELHIQAMAQSMQGLQRFPLVQVDAGFDADDAQEKAQRHEGWVSSKMQQEKVPQSIYEFEYNRYRDPVAVMYVGWREDFERSFVTRYWDGVSYEADGETKLAVPIEQVPPGEEWEEVPFEETRRTYSGRDYRVVDLADFYLFPSDSVSIQQAVGVIERRLYTEDELLRGVETGDFDEEVVADLLAGGPTDDWQGNEFREARQDREGLEEMPEGFYTCYEYYGYLPLIREGGEIVTPDEAIGIDVRAVLCPGANAALHLDYSQYPGRPYLSCSMLKIPNRFLGKGLCQLVNELQEEATTNLRASIDGINLIMTPSMYATGEWIASNAGKWRIRPGGFIPRSKSGDVEPVQWDQSAVIGLQLSDVARSRAQGMISSQNYGTMPSKQRRVIEVQNVLQSVDQKFSLYRMPMEWFFCELAAWMVALEQTFGEEAEQYARSGASAMTVYPEDLEGDYLYSTSVTRMISDPTMLYNIVKSKAEAQLNYFVALQKFGMLDPEKPRQLWHAARQTILELDPSERNVEAWIGPEPQPIVQPPMSPEMAGIPGGMGMEGAAGILGAMPMGMPDLLALAGAGNGFTGNGAGGMGGVQ